MRNDLGGGEPSGAVAICREPIHRQSGGRTGRILFERDGRMLRPTNEAAQLNMRLDALFEALEKLDGPPELEQETLQIIAPPTYAHRYLVHHIASFLKANPHFFVGLEVASSIWWSAAFSTSATTSDFLASNCRVTVLS